jgi:hypothetical protein
VAGDVAAAAAFEVDGDVDEHAVASKARAATAATGAERRKRMRVSWGG